MTVPLDPNAVYVTPTGRRCRWDPQGGKYRHHTHAAFFAYLDRPRQLGEHDGFTLTAENYRLLKKEASNGQQSVTDRA